MNDKHKIKIRNKRNNNKTPLASIPHISRSPPKYNDNNSKSDKNLLKKASNHQLFHKKPNHEFFICNPIHQKDKPGSSYKSRLHYDQNVQNNRDKIKELKGVSSAKILESEFIRLESEEIDKMVEMENNLYVKDLNNSNVPLKLIKRTLKPSPKYYRNIPKNSHPSYINNGQVKLDSLLLTEEQERFDGDNMGYYNGNLLHSSESKSKKLKLPGINSHKRIPIEDIEIIEPNHPFKSKNVNRKIENYHAIKSDIKSNAYKKRVIDSMFDMVLANNLSNLENFGLNFKQELEDDINDQFKKLDIDNPKYMKEEVI